MIEARGYRPLTESLNSVTIPSLCKRNCSYAVCHRPFFEDLCKKIQSISNDSLKDQAEMFCDELSDYLTYNNVTATLPLMYFEEDEDSVYFEWIFDRFRFGFLFSDKEGKSEWFLVSMVGEKTNRVRSLYKGRTTIEYVMTYIEGCA